jgi:hypothetical protein
MTTIAKERLLNLDASPLPARDEPNTNIPRWLLRAIVMGDMIIIMVLSYLYIQNGGTHGAAGQITWLSGGLGIHLIFAPIIYIYRYYNSKAITQLQTLSLSNAPT